MNEAMAPELAVAILTETDQSVWPYRRAPDRPLTGYALLTRNGRDLRIYMLVENGRTLSNRSIGESFYYEGWLLTAGNPVSLGAFNAGPGGEANAEVRLGPVDASRAMMRGVRVTAEPFGGSLFGHRPILQGELIWLSDLQPTAGPGPAAGPPGPEPGWPEPWPPEQPGQPQREQPMPPLPGPWVSEPPLPGPAVSEPELPPPWVSEPGQPQPAQSEPQLAGIAGTAAPDGWDAEFTMVSARTEPAKHHRQTTQAKAEPQAGVGGQADAGQPPVDLSRMRTEPAAPGAAQHGLVRITLVARHPMAPRGGGTGYLDHRTGRVNLNLRGLPSPPSLGREASTDRPFNAYRVWLMGQQAGTRMPLGLCTRVWGENWRFESDSAVPLSRYDTILITADDRSATALNLSAPQVLMASYSGLSQ